MYKIFLLFSAISACFVINPVQSLLWLIVTFLIGAFIMLELGAELLAILIILVYVGAIAVLFLFVVMLLNIRKVELNALVINYFPIGIFVGLLLMLECSLVVYLFYINIKAEYFYLEWIKYIDFTSNIEVIGYLFYLLYCHYFLILSLILLVALIGAVVLVK